MKFFKKTTAIALLTALCLLVCSSCKKEEESIYGGDPDLGVYDPYNNPYKPDVNTGDAISVTGKVYTFTGNMYDEVLGSIEVRDASGELSVTAGNALKKLYMNSSFRFTAENKVVFEDGNADGELFFEMPETEGTREGNVLTVKNTNASGVTYDVRFEINDNIICVIHNGHTYNTEGTYVRRIFEAK